MKKKFDAVKYMREARRRIAEEFAQASDEEILKMLRDKYGDRMSHEAGVYSPQKRVRGTRR
ncbi:MAG: hypothetical protein HY347_06995 [candidate division NC10 bacterium]|nr:hypothetical protein [candidate division NC10 bacterium]